MSADKFRNKFRISSARASWWDYGSDAHYFVTICTKDKAHCFGKIIEKQLLLSPTGEVAKKYWQEIPQHFPCVKLDSFVIMPNHVHGIITIDNDTAVICKGAINCVSTTTDENKQSGGITGNHNPMLHKNLSRIIRWYKGRVTFESNEYATIWQSRYHDRIIRDHHEYRRIAHYIETNIQNWNDDQFYL